MDQDHINELLPEPMLRDLSYEPICSSKRNNKRMHVRRNNLFVASILCMHVPLHSEKDNHSGTNLVYVLWF